jgi:hypothetical protein
MGSSYFAIIAVPDTADEELELLFIGSGCHLDDRDPDSALG